ARFVDFGVGGPEQPSLFGLSVADADGKVFNLTATASRRTFDPSGMPTDQLKLIARTTEKDQGKPARMVFNGTRAKQVEVPFKLTSVPVSAGTGDIPKR